MKTSKREKEWQAIKSFIANPFGDEAFAYALKTMFDCRDVMFAAGIDTTFITRQIRKYWQLAS